MTRGKEFDDFVVAAGNRLLRSAFALTGDRNAAEDLVQDVLEHVYVAWPRVEDPLAYARRALINKSTNRWRYRARHPETNLTDVDQLATADDTAQADERDRLIRAIAGLPRRQRAVIVLRFLEDLSEADAANALSCSVGTVKSQTSRALARLRVALADEKPSQATRARSTT